jgi:hypothetical protein
MLRRALVEQTLLQSKKKQPKSLEAPKLKIPPPKSGTGFANTDSSMNKATRLATEQAKVIHRDGVVRIDNALSTEVADKLRQYLLDQQQVAQAATELDPSKSKLFYGVEQSRKNRCDMHLSLLRGGVDGKGDEVEHILANALKELLGTNGTLRAIYENLVTTDGEFYELAGIITNPGSYRQTIHPDLPYQKEAPLSVVFLALQDVTEEMGPTSFLLKTNTAQAIDIFDSGDMDAKDEQLINADCRMATLKKGDAVIFDARVLHCGGANDGDHGATRVMLNFSFRNPKVKGDLGYKGSMMPGYVGVMTLGDVTNALCSYSGGELDPFSQYGNGLVRP